MKKLLFILFLLPLFVQAQIRTAYRFRPPEVIIDSIPEDPPPGPVDTITLSYLTLPQGEIASIINRNGITIRNKQFTNPNPLVNGGKIFSIFDSEDITFENCYFDASYDVAIDAYNVKRLIVKHCFFANNKTGVYATNCEDVIVDSNQFVNPIGPFARGQAVQFNTVGTSATGQCSVSFNRIEAFLGESDPEDLININNSHGKPGRPIKVHNNILRGGGPSMSGGGILIGERGGNYQSMKNNKAYNPGNYVFSMSGGAYNIIADNYGWMDSHRTIDTWSNVGIIMWSQNESLLVPCDNDTLSGNSLYVVSARFGANPLFDGLNCTYISGGNSYYNNSSDTIAFKAEMNFDEKVITAVSDDDLWTAREKSQQFRRAHWIPRPTVVAEADKTVGTTSTTLTASGTSPNGGSAWKWVQVSGPNTATITNSTSQTCTVSDLINGVYVFRVTQHDNQGAGASDKTNLTKN